ncbi:type II toxin-antitoxin system HicB family antitoxin [Acinetobacter rongchengensis]|uniref:Type II toxin-antitoxin system HicB family antitoxin n=1 Tax=Acinetobacter rongchengensis TaxID=2419601 RepID=A0A3A8ERG9_9GAMM|nr:type II toxin-antitoxin system HicB family antitoxin [Acinetobacter rongchengensis]RKG37467.1 type II toxin-antitoxin system HicB family antitoxin [Acinetobacter rongchengensis]
MLYPVYVHKDENTAYGLTFPDFDGCFSAADEMQDIPQMVQEAVELYFEGEDMALPQPSSPEQWLGDDRFEGGYWLLVNIDTSKINTKSIRINISMSESLVNRIDAVAKKQHLSRSAFLAKSAELALSDEY